MLIMNKKIVGIILSIVIVIVILLILTIYLLNTNAKNNTNDTNNEITENTTTEEENKVNDGGLVEKTEEEVRNDEEIASKMSEPEKLYGDIKMYIYNNTIFSFDELTIGQYNIKEDTATVEYLIKKGGKVSQRMYVTINLTNNTYTIKHFQ